MKFTINDEKLRRVYEKSQDKIARENAKDTASLMRPEKELYCGDKNAKKKNRGHLNKGIEL